MCAVELLKELVNWSILSESTVKWANKSLYCIYTGCVGWRVVDVWNRLLGNDHSYFSYFIGLAFYAATLPPCVSEIYVYLLRIYSMRYLEILALLSLFSWQINVRFYTLFIVCMCLHTDHIILNVLHYCAIILFMFYFGYCRPIIFNYTCWIIQECQTIS